MEKKEFYRRHLPHFQQPGQLYFITWCTKDAVPPKALNSYSIQLMQIKSKIEEAKRNNESEDTICLLKAELYIIRKKYMKAFDDLLHLQTKYIIDLSKSENTKIIIDALCFWEGKRIENYAICVMSNHVHWVLKVLNKDENGNLVYLQDILQSVKRFYANRINFSEKCTGSLWHNESYDTTIRDELHFENAVNYTLQNPVKAGLVKNWWDWKGTKLFL